MKKILLLVSILAMLLVASDEIDKVHRLTIINKANIEIGIRLQGVKDDEHLFYLTIPEGNRSAPTISTFDIPGDEYNMVVYYVETYDPVYGYSCDQPAPTKLFMFRNERVVFLPCGETPHNVGERTMRKFLPYPIYRYPFHLYWIKRFIY